METWTISTDCPGYREKTIQRGVATIIIRRPILDKEEQAKREKQTVIALESAMRNYIYRRKTV
jgi:hypothetical protein